MQEVIHNKKQHQGWSGLYSLPSRDAFYVQIFKKKLFTGGHSQGKKTVPIQWEEHVWNKDAFLFLISSFLISFASGLFSFFLYLTPSKFETLLLFPSPVPFLCKTCTQSKTYSFPAVVGRNNGAGSHTQPSALSWADTGGDSVTAAGPAHRLWLTCLIGETTSLGQTSLEQTFWRCLPDTLQQQGTVPPSRATQLALENAA